MARYVLGLARDEELVDFGIEAASRGARSQAIVELAGVVATERARARELFERAANDLHLHTPSRRNAVMLLAREVARGIITGEVATDVGAARIWELSLLAHPEHLAGLDTFVYAASEWPERPELREELARAITEAAFDLVGR